MKIEELSIGMEYRLKKSFSDEDVYSFSRMSLDDNPIHVDEEYASKTIFGKKIVHGFLTGSLFSAIIGTKMPGYGSVYLKQEMNFRKPVYHNETIEAVVKVSNIVKEKSLVYLDTFCVNSNGDVVIDGYAIVKLI